MRNLTVEQQYSPSLGSTSVMDGFTTDTNAPYTFSSSLPTQVFKVYAKNISTGDNFMPEVLSANEYGVFGNLLNGRGFSQRAYSRGFNGMLKDNDVKGNGNSVNYKYRILLLH
jgi:hypothetical protein